MLATNMFFWDWGGAPVAPVEVIVLPTTSKGSGKSHDEYRALPEDYWKAHAQLHEAPAELPEETIIERRTRLTAEVHQIIAEQEQLASMRQEQTAVQQALPTASSVDELKALALYSSQLKIEITKLEATNKARIIRAKSLRFSLYH